MKALSIPGRLALGVVAVGVVAMLPAQAAGPAARYAGMAPSSVAGCPNIAWRLAKDADGTLRGIMWYDDLSGMSKASGSAENGKFHVTMVSVIGNGPVGTVDGDRSSDGAGEAKMLGEGCANMTVKMQPLPIWGGTG